MLFRLLAMEVPSAWRKNRERPNTKPCTATRAPTTAI